MYVRMCTHVVKEKTKCSLILVGESIYARCMLVNGRGSIRTTEYLFGLYRRVIPRNDIEEFSINEKNLSPSTSIFQEEGNTPLDVDKGQQYQHYSVKSSTLVKILSRYEHARIF